MNRKVYTVKKLWSYFNLNFSKSMIIYYIVFILTKSNHFTKPAIAEIKFYLVI